MTEMSWKGSTEEPDFSTLVEVDGVEMLGLSLPASETAAVVVVNHDGTVFLRAALTAGSSLVVDGLVEIIQTIREGGLPR